VSTRKKRGDYSENKIYEKTAQMQENSRKAWQYTQENCVQTDVELVGEGTNTSNPKGNEFLVRRGIVRN